MRRVLYQLGGLSLFPDSNVGSTAVPLTTAGFLANICFAYGQMCERPIFMTVTCGKKKKEKRPKQWENWKREKTENMHEKMLHLKLVEATNATMRSSSLLLVRASSSFWKFLLLLVTKSCTFSQIVMMQANDIHFTWFRCAIGKSSPGLKLWCSGLAFPSAT